MWGAPSSADMCQPNIPALFGTPALLGIGLPSIGLYCKGVPAVQSDFTGTIERGGEGRTHLLLALVSDD